MYQGPIQDNAHGVVTHPPSKAAFKRLLASEGPEQIALYSTSAFHPQYRITLAELRDRVLANKAPSRVLFVTPSPQDRRSFGTVTIKPDGKIVVS